MGKVLYNDLVVTLNDKPLKSFVCTENIGEAIDTAKAFIQNEKLKAMSNGDAIPDLKLGRVKVDLSSQSPYRTEIDYKFQSDTLGSAATPKGGAEEVLATA